MQTAGINELRCLAHRHMVKYNSNLTKEFTGWHEPGKLFYGRGGACVTVTMACSNKCILNHKWSPSGSHLVSSSSFSRDIYDRCSHMLYLSSSWTPSATHIFKILLARWTNTVHTLLGPAVFPYWKWQINSFAGVELRWPQRYVDDAEF